MNDDIYFADATELARRIREHEYSPVEVMEAHLERIGAVNPALNAIIAFADDAMDRAREAEQALVKGRDIGPLGGVPFTCKDSFDVAGMHTTCGSKLYEDRVAAVDATAVARLERAGAILLGKTNTPEFTLWWETDNRVFGRTNNPWNTDLITGGSSGGEAAALATGMSPLSLGSDVGGSLRMPAHYCGVVGFKPTHGRVPLTGLVPEVLLDIMHVGPMARTVRDVALALRLMSGPDGIDPRCLPFDLPDVPEVHEEPLGLRVGWLADGAFAPVAPQVRAVVEKAAEALRAAACTVEHVSLPLLEEHDPLWVFGTMGNPEAGVFFESLIKGREDELSDVMRRRLSAPWVEAREYFKSLTGRDAIRRGMTAYFETYDLLLCPTLPLPAYPHRARELTIDGITIKAPQKMKTVIPWDLTGSPALSLPFGMSEDGLPIGVQLVGRHFDEATVLRAALALEQVSDVRELHPELP